MNIKDQLLHQAIIQLDDVTPRKSTKEHGYHVAVTSLNKIGEDSCVKRGIFLKSESHKSIFLSKNSMSSSSTLLFGHPQSIQTRSTDENRCLHKILKHDIFLKSEPCKSRLNSEKTTGNHRYVASQNKCS